MYTNRKLDSAWANKALTLANNWGFRRVGVATDWEVSGLLLTNEPSLLSRVTDSRQTTAPAQVSTGHCLSTKIGSGGQVNRWRGSKSIQLRSQCR